MNAKLAFWLNSTIIFIVTATYTSSPAAVFQVNDNNFNQSDLVAYITSPFAFNFSNLNNKDPLFAGEWQEKHVLISSSPCQNTGNNNAPSLPTIDLMGNVRIQGGVVDMGAYEGASNVVTAQPVLSPLMLLLK